jgi:hypothetical protein
MAVVEENAAVVLPLAARLSVSRTARRAVRLTVSPAVEAAAHFGAAIHNGHWGQQRQVVEHHCARAVAMDAGVARIMEDYLEIAAKRAPAWMNAALDRMASRDQLTLVRYILTMLPFQPERVDPFLAGSVARALGPEDECRLERTWCEEYAGASVRTPLHLPRFAVRTLGHREAFALVHPPRGWPAFLRAYTPVSSFTLIEDAARAVELGLTARRPVECTERGDLGVHVNGHCVLCAPLDRRWTTWRVTVPAECIRRGLNDVSVHWPAARWDSPAGLTRAAEEIEAAGVPELVPTFGEIHSLWAANPA